MGQPVKTLGTKRHEALVNALISIREQMGWTQTDLAKKIGEYQSFVARLESGQRRVDVIEFLELAAVMQFDPCHILRKVQSVEE
ncbi:MAG: helix-turn-helix domain-containing protein [Alphaproteobacteria bacterium]|nr:helix-turn-helix domain-containing protein [Alphaproteobacteria bacterium]